jgi:hypothetical protein
MLYRLEMRLDQDVTLERIASTLEATADQVRQMSSVNAAHSMNVPTVAYSVESGKHGIIGPPSLGSPKVRAAKALRSEAAERETKAVELEENEEDVYVPSDWRRIRERADYLRKVADELETDDGITRY